MRTSRKRTSTGILALCFALSLGINYAAVVVGLQVLVERERPTLVTADARIKSCRDGLERSGDLLQDSLSGDVSQLAGGVEAFLLGAECPPEPVPMEVALLEEPTPVPPAPEPELQPEPEPEPKPEKKPQEPEPEPEPEPEVTPQPEPEPEPEPQPEPEPEPEKQHFVLEQLKMVEQLDEFDEQDSPDDAEYLSNINRDVEEQTRAEVTNLVEDAKVPEASQQEPSKEPEVGTADETKIAELEEQKSQVNRKAPNETPQPVDKRPEQQDPKPTSLLALREQAPRDHKEAMTRHDALANAADDGNLNPDRPEAASLQARDQQARVDRHDKKFQFKLSQNDLDALYGKDLQAKKNIISQRESKKKGIWEDARKRWQSPLENMVPEVRPGNQTALKSRKHPFARYIAQMHRSIHDAWAWGYLDGLDTRGRGHALNDEKLWTRVEIVLNGNGTIDKVRTVRYSGNMTFDAAAREIVYAAGPYPNPPRSIRSGNGKIYMHWAFHRDARACGTFGASPFILDNAGQGDRPDPTHEVRPTTSQLRANRSKRLAKQVGPTTSGPEGPAPPPGTPRGGGSGGGSHAGHNHGPGGHGSGSHAGHNHGPGGHPPPGPIAKGPRGQQAVPLLPSRSEQPKANETADPRAKQTAEGWINLLRKADVERMVGRSSVPFYAGDQIVARTKKELTEVLRSMADEARGKKATAVKVYTAAGLRKKFGGLPAGVVEGRPRNYAVTKIGGSHLILLLEKRFGSWRVIGMTQ